MHDNAMQYNITKYSIMQYNNIISYNTSLVTYTSIVWYIIVHQII